MAGPGASDALLTAVPGKMPAYRSDPYFREALDTASCVFGPDGLEHFLFRHTFVMFKPEAVVGRCVRPALELLRRAGALLGAARLVQLDRLAIRETWRFQFNNATWERVAFVDELDVATPCVFVMVTPPPSRHPAALWLSALKGPSAPAGRRPGHLRSVMRSQSRLVTYIHTPDEPADVIRELGIFFDGDKRAELLTRACRPGDEDEVEPALVATESVFPEHDLSFAAAAARIRAVLKAVVRPDDRGAALRACDELAPGRHDAWLAVSDAAYRANVELPFWDRITVMAEVIPTVVPGCAQMLPSNAAELWNERPFVAERPDPGCGG